MSNKYLGTKDGLIGPIEKTFGRPDYWNTESEKEHNESYEAWQNYLASFTPIPCEGWVPVKGQEYVEGVHFILKECDNSSPCKFKGNILVCHDNGCQHKVAVPIPAAPQDMAIFDAVTFSGLKGELFEKERDNLIKCAGYISGAANSESGHLGDIISCIRTTISILDLQAKKITDVFNKQKGTIPAPAAPQEGAQDGDVPAEIKQKIDRKIKSVVDDHVIDVTVWEEEMFKEFAEFGYSLAQPAPAYPAEFVEWAVDNAIYLGYSSWRFRRLVYTTAELFTEWKRIQSQSK